MKKLNKLVITSIIGFISVLSIRYIIGILKWGVGPGTYTFILPFLFTLIYFINTLFLPLQKTKQYHIIVLFSVDVLCLCTMSVLCVYGDNLTKVFGSMLFGIVIFVLIGIVDSVLSLISKERIDDIKVTVLNIIELIMSIIIAAVFFIDYIWHAGFSLIIPFTLLFLFASLIAKSVHFLILKREYI